MDKFYGRKSEIKTLAAFTAKQGAGYTHVRGRRRVGKSELLKLICSKNKKAMYFYGSEDETTQSCIDRFIKSMEKIFPDIELADLKKSTRSWDRVLEEFGKKAEAYNGTIILALDEIQWIAKQKSGFVGVLKHHWSEWKKGTSIKLILCGSSNKFFSKNTDAEFNTLRGLKTHADIWVNPFSLREVKQYFFKDRVWSEEQIALLYMMFGGIPYYLEQIGGDKNYYRAINEALFTASTIFLDEAQAVLKLEFNNKSINNVLRILDALGQDGTTLAKVSKATGIPKQTVSDIVSKLVDYEILFEKYPMGMKRKADNSDLYYIMKDFYLNFYFQVLSPLEKKIKSNTRGMIFNRETISSNSGHYIQNFSGKAFELLMRYILENPSKKNEKLLAILKLQDKDYAVGTYWVPNKTQLDLIVECDEDRESRIIEVKWVNKPLSSSSVEAEVLKKEYPSPKGYSMSYFLASNNISSSKMNNVKPIKLSDLF